MVNRRSHLLITAGLAVTFVSSMVLILSVAVLNVRGNASWGASLFYIGFGLFTLGTVTILVGTVPSEETDLNGQSRLAMTLGLAVTLLGSLFFILYSLVIPTGIGQQHLANDWFFYPLLTLLTTGVIIVLVAAALSRGPGVNRKSRIPVLVGLSLVSIWSVLMLWHTPLMNIVISWIGDGRWFLYAEYTLLAAGMILVLIGVVLSGELSRNGQGRLLIIIGLAAALVFPLVMLLKVAVSPAAYWPYYPAFGFLAAGITVVRIGVAKSNGKTEEG
jgi:hypothetical protein